MAWFSATNLRQAAESGEVACRFPQWLGEMSSNGKLLDAERPNAA